MAQQAPASSPFTTIDQMPPEAAAFLVAGLERTAAAPEIQRLRRIADGALEPGPGQRLLDAGCGAGEAARQLGRAVAPGGEVVALDFSTAVVAAARGRHDGGPVRYVTGDVTALAFSDGEFDGVRCERVLQHLADPDRAVAELTRVTRPGGRVCLVDSDWDSLVVDGLPDDLVAELREHLYRRVMPPHRGVGRTLRRRLVHAGLADVTATPVACYFPDPPAAAEVLVMFNREVPAMAGVMPDGLRDRWFAAVDAAGARGDFLAALTIWVAAGSRPA